MQRKGHFYLFTLVILTVVISGEITTRKIAENNVKLAKVQVYEQNGQMEMLFFF